MGDRIRAVVMLLLMLTVSLGSGYYMLTESSAGADQPEKVVAEAETGLHYVVKDPDDLFSVRKTDLENVEQLYIADGELFSEKNVVLKYKDSSEILVYKNVSYSGMDQYKEIILNPFLLANPEFQYGVRDGLSGIGKRFGIDHDPINLIAKQKAESAGKGLLQLLSTLLVMGLMFYILIKMQMSGNSNTIDMFKPSDITDSLDDLVGMNDIKSELLQLEEMIESREIYTEYGEEKAFNVMMTGPAGTGKTKIARCLAKRLNVPLFYASAASLETGYVGGGPRTLKKLYKQACKFKRSIIFLDEAETVLLSRQRKTNSKYENDSTTTLLSLLDGVATSKGHEVIWIVASNFDEHKLEMDEAMLRRFALKINFRLPNHEERREIMQRLINKRSDTRVSKNIDLDHLAGITNGMSPAILETLISRASLMAVKKRELIDQDTLLAAFERVAIGLTDRATTDKMNVKRRIIAAHEAGHFLMQVHNTMLRTGGDYKALNENLNVIKISTESVSKMGALGFVLSKTEDVPLQSRLDYERMICELYAGMANEELYYGSAGVTAGAHNDIEKVTKLMNVMFNQVGYYNRAKLNYGLLAQSGVDTPNTQMRAMEELSQELYEITTSTLLRYRVLSDKIVEILMDHYVMNLQDVIPHLVEFYETRPEVLDTYQKRSDDVKVA